MKNSKTSKGKSSPKSFKYVLDKDWILTKVSHVNQAMSDFQAVVHDEHVKACHFLRILRLGHGIVDKV